MTLRETIAEQIKTIGELKQNIRFDILKNKEDFQGICERLNALNFTFEYLNNNWY